MATLLLAGGAGLLVHSPVSPFPLDARHADSRLSPAGQLAEARASVARGDGPGGSESPHLPSLTPRASVSSGPNLTFGVVMTYDGADGYVLAVSLNASAGPFNNSYGPTELTWKFSAGNWSELSTVGQVPATLSPGLVFDAHDGYVLLYGGRLMDTSSPFAPVTNQTFSYRAGVWSNLSGNSSSAPTSVDFANLVYDEADSYVLLYNEIGITDADPAGYYNTTWTYAAGVWTNITATAGTPPEMYGSMAYDAVDEYVLYFGGYTWTNQLSNSTWTFHAGVWTNISSLLPRAPSPRMSIGIDYDSSLGSVLVYGGLAHLLTYNASAYSYETWAYAKGTWTLLGTNGTIWSIQTMVYDAADNVSLLLGSNSSLSASPNVVTWEFSSGSWTVAAPLFPRMHWVTDVDHSFSIDVGRPLNEGGVTYAYSNLPPGCSSQDTPTLRCIPTAAGNYSVSVTISGAAGLRAVATTMVRVDPAPEVIGFTGSLAFGEVGVADELTVTAGLGTGPFSYAYSGLPSGCASANTSTLRCTPEVAGSYQITADVTDSVGVTVAANRTLSVSPRLAIGALTVNQSALDLDQPIAITTELTGGVGPYQYTYSGLPKGCGSDGTDRLVCDPNATGSFDLEVNATDTLGVSAVGATRVVVNALPTVSAFVTSGARISAGGTVQLSTTISGGTAPFRYSYTGLPSGCTSVDAAVLTCSGLPDGNYSVQVTVSDATGATVHRTTTFAVVTPAITGGPVPSMAPGFWWGFGLAAFAIGAAAIAGGYRLRMTRQGSEIVRKLRSEGELRGASEGPSPRGTPTSEDGEEGNGQLGPA